MPWLLSHSGSAKSGSGSWQEDGRGASVRQLAEPLDVEAGGDGPYLHRGISNGVLAHRPVLVGCPEEGDHGTDCGIDLTLGLGR